MRAAQTATKNAGAVLYSEYAVAVVVAPAGLEPARRSRGNGF